MLRVPCVGCVLSSLAALAHAPCGASMMAGPHFFCF